MTLRDLVAIGMFLLMFLLMGIGWYAMTLRPGRYRRPRVWVYGTTLLFVLFTVALVLLTKPSSLAEIVLLLAFGLVGSAISVLGLWIPMRQRDWVRGWDKSQSDNAGKQNR